MYSLFDLNGPRIFKVRDSGLEIVPTVGKERRHLPLQVCDLTAEVLRARKSRLSSFQII